MKPISNSITVLVNSLAGFVLDAGSRADGRVIVFDQGTNEYTHVDLPSVTFEALQANGDVGSGANQVAIGNHLHTGVYEELANKSLSILTDQYSDTKYPSVKAVKTYADAVAARISTGAITPPDIIDNGDGTATITSTTVNIYPAPDFMGTMLTFTVPQATLSFTDGAEEYVSVRFNLGSPIYYKETVGADMNHSDILPMFVVWRLGTEIHSLNFDSLGAGLANKAQSAMYHTETYKLSTDGGLVISEAASPSPRTINVTPGMVYTGAIHQDVGPFTSASDRMTEAIHTAGGWTYTNVSVYNNTQVNPGTTLTNINNNKYGVRWFYRSIGDAKQVFYVLGTGGSYNNPQEAALELERTDLPSIIRHHCILIGRSIIKYNATSGDTQSLLIKTYSFSGVINHDDTNNIHLAGSGITYGHINDQAQTIYGIKTFNSSPIIPTAAANTNSTIAASTAYADAKVADAINDGVTTIAPSQNAVFDALALKLNLDTITQTKGITGFIDGSNIVVTYNHTNRTITLTGDLRYMWRGVMYTLTSPWTSSAHTATNGRWFLYSTDGTTFTWSNTVWMFSDLMVAAVGYNTSVDATFAIRETHCTMDYWSHESIHTNIGTSRETGGTATVGTYAFDTDTDAAITPGFEAATLKDEDLFSVLPTLTQGTYTLIYVNPSQAITYVVGATVPFTFTGGSYIQYNNTTTGTLVTGSTLRFYNVYQILTPATSDANSQRFRMLFLQPQAAYTSLSLAQAEDVRGLNLANLSNTSAEFVIYARITYATNASYGSSGKVVIPAGGITYVAGSRASQINIIGAVTNNHQLLSNLTWSNSGHIGTASSLAAFDASGLATTILTSAFSPVAGSSSITTVGTITSGIWNATVIGTSYGGTGLTTLGTQFQLLRVNSGATGLEYFTPTWTSNTGTVTSIDMTVPTGLEIAGSPITSSGTLAVTFTTGYSIPTTADQSNWSTAYGWGNHASAGYLQTTIVSSLSSGYLPYWDGSKFVNSYAQSGTGGASLYLNGVYNSTGGIIQLRDSIATGSNQTFAGIGFSSSPGYDWTIGKYSNLTQGLFQIRDQASNVRFQINESGQISIQNLSGASTRIVTADTNGTLGVTANNSANWDSAYSWGNHSLAGYLLSSSYTATDVLSKLITVDGDGSNLDADLLDGQHGSYYATSSHTHSYLPLAGGTLTGALVVGITDSSSQTDLYVNPTTKTSGDLIKAAIGGTAKFTVGSTGNLVITGNLTSSGYGRFEDYIYLGDASSSDEVSLRFSKPYYGRLNFAVPIANSKAEVRYSAKGSTGGNGNLYFVVASTEAADTGNNLLLGVAASRAFLTNAVGYSTAGTTHIGGQSWAYDGVMQVSGNANAIDTDLGVVTIDGKLAVGKFTPTARLHLKAGTATASSAPLKFTSGTLLSAPEAGAVEFDGTNLLFTPSSSRYKLWSEGNDGTGSGLDADLLDGQHGSYYAAASHTHNYAGSASAGGAANSVANSLLLKFDTGTTEGTDKYTFDGSTAKTIDFKAGTNITIDKAAGSVTINASGGGGGLTYDFQLSENITAGNVVQLLSNGTIEKITSSSVTESIPSGSEYTFRSGGAVNMTSIAFDPFNANKFAIAYRNSSGDNYGKIVVGTISGSTISYGTTYTFNSASTNYIAIAFDKLTQNSLSVAFSDEGTGNYLSVVAMTLSGTTVTMGTKTVLSSNTITDISMDSDPFNAGVYLVSCRNTSNSGYGTVYRFSVSGTTVSTPAPSSAVFNAASTGPSSILFDKAVSGKFVVAWVDYGNSNYGSVIVGTVGTSITFGTEYVSESLGLSRVSLTQIGALSSTFVFVYTDSSNTTSKARTFSYSGTTVTYGTTVTMNNAYTEYISAGSYYSDTSRKFVVTYMDGGNSNYCTAIVGTVASNGLTITFGSEYVVNNATSFYVSSGCSSLTPGQFVVVYYDGGTTSGNSAVGLIGVSSTNLSSSKLIGVLDETGTTGQTKPVTLLGGIDTNRSSLTPGAYYYVQVDGTITTSSTSPAVYYGKAISATAILTKLP